jgi:hypothetical protein
MMIPGTPTPSPTASGITSDLVEEAPGSSFVAVGLGDEVTVTADEST